MTTRSATDWELEREIVLTRVIDAPRDVVFAAWTTDEVDEWFGPDGFTCKTYSLDVRAGGQWRFDFIAADGTLYENLIQYLEVIPPVRLVFDHGTADPADPNRFRTTVTFDEQANGKTVLTLRQLHPTAERREQTVSFGAVELGMQTLAKLDAFVHRTP